MPDFFSSSVSSITDARPGGGGGTKASVSDCLPLAAPIGLSPLLILTLCGSERVLVVSTELLDDSSCFTPGVGCPGDGRGGRGGIQTALFVTPAREFRETWFGHPMTVWSDGVE